MNHADVQPTPGGGSAWGPWEPINPEEENKALTWLIDERERLLAALERKDAALREARDMIRRPSDPCNLPRCRPCALVRQIDAALRGEGE